MHSQYKAALQNAPGPIVAVHSTLSPIAGQEIVDVKPANEHTFLEILV
jgi:hypothetical protein